MGMYRTINEKYQKLPCRKSIAIVISASLVIILACSLILVPHVSALETITLTATANITCTNASQSNNDSNDLIVANLYGVAHYSFLKFDLSSIPKDANIESIKLKLKSNTFIPDGGRYVTAETSSTDWTESTLTWDNKPEPDKYLNIKWVELMQDWTAWDCTYNLKNERDTVSIILTISTGTSGYVTFYSTQSAYPPQLEITYSPALPSSPINPIISIIAIVGSFAFLGGMLFLIYFLKRGKAQAKFR